MAIPENPSEMTPEWARDFLREYDEAYDVLDSQGQFNPAQIHATLQKRYFWTSVNPSVTLAKIRNLAEGVKIPQSLAVAEKVADAASKALDVPHQQHYDFPPSATTEALLPKTEMQANYEDFEAAFAMQTADGAKPEEIVFDTVVNGARKRISMPYVVARTVTMPSAKSVRILILQQQLRRNEYPE